MITPVSTGVFCCINGQTAFSRLTDISIFALLQKQSNRTSVRRNKSTIEKP